ncbi:MAG: hypothetical protein GC193_14825 [Cryomorphaceae bacterium]|nr:hypothetical protein [Cryomorphaceae bacterium]
MDRLLADKLAEDSHFRRKAHRDMVLWYQQQGMSKAAQTEKEVLFDLVGIEDDRILYPLRVGCAKLIWWKDDSISETGACGMG